MAESRLFKKSYLLVCFLLIATVMVSFLAYGARAETTGVDAASPIHHYLYVFPDQTVYVYDMDNGFKLIKQISFPTANGGRGIMADPAGGFLYLIYGGDGGAHGNNGSLLKYNLIKNTIAWTKTYPFGVDSGALSPDGKTIYMPDGEASYDGTWHVINASDGTVKGSIFTVTGNAAHNTIVGFTGQNVYMGGLNNPTFFTASTSTNKVTQAIGSMVGGVRPFTINGSESLVFTTHTGFLGFQVSNLKTGKILYTVPIQGFSAPAGSVSSHGITISPGEKNLYVIDQPNNYIHEFDISGLPGIAPKQIANIALPHQFTGMESPCLYDCQKEGWLLHVGDGRYVVVGDSGDIIDTKTNKSAFYLATVANTRKYLEVDWHKGYPIFTSTRQGMGYVGVPAGTPLPTPLNSMYTPTPTGTATVTPSATPGTLLAKDTFKRANQQFWGKASDGLTWGGDANTQTVFSINNNAGQIANGSGPYNAVLGPSTTDAEVLFTGSLSTFTNNNLGAVLRWQDTNNWYKAYIDGTNLVIQSKLNGTTTILTQAAFAATPNTAYNLRFRVVGTTLYAKAWATTQTEPAAWTATTTSSAFSSGRCGLRIQVVSSSSATVTFFQATTAS